MKRSKPETQRPRGPFGCAKSLSWPSLDRKKIRHETFDHSVSILPLLQDSLRWRETRAEIVMLSIWVIDWSCNLSLTSWSSWKVSGSDWSARGSFPHPETRSWAMDVGRSPGKVITRRVLEWPLAMGGRGACSNTRAVAHFMAIGTGKVRF